MRPKKPDRWDRMSVNLPICEYGTCSVDSVAKLLRKEHEWVVGMVEAQLALWEECAPRGYEANQYGRDCRAMQCKDILNLLKRRAK